jgi:hypothetical protein
LAEAKINKYLTTKVGTKYVFLFQINAVNMREWYKKNIKEVFYLSLADTGNQ